MRKEAPRPFPDEVPLADNGILAYLCTMKRIKPWEELTIRDNFLFLKVMRNETLCRRLLELLLGISIRSIGFPETEKTIDTGVSAKSVRLDVYVEDSEGRAFDVEMQAEDMQQGELPLRARYYQSMIDQGLLEKGQIYTDLRESFVIFICDFDPFQLGLRRYTFRNRCDEDRELVLKDRATRIFLNARGTIGDESPDVRAFLDYVRTNSATGGFATEIAAEVNRVKASSVAKREYMTLAMEIQRQIAQEKDKWFAEGEATRSRTIALRLLQGGMPMEQVAAYTDLTADQVRELGQQ